MKTYQEFIEEAKKCWPGYKKKGTQKLFGKTYNRCVKEGKVEWDNPKRPLQSGLTPREKNRAKRISLGVENPNRVSFGGKSWDISDKDYERYGKLKMAHDNEKGKKTPRGKRHEFKQIEDIEGTLVGTRGRKIRKWKDQKNLPRNSKLWKQDERQKVYHQNDLKEPKESFNYSIEEGKVEWDNPKRPLQSGLTPREKNRAVRKRLGIENPDTDKPSFFKDGPGEKEYERYGKLKTAHDTEKDKKVPDEKRHKFKSVAKGRLGGEHSAGRIRRIAGVHSGAQRGRNAEKGKGSYAVMSQTQGGKERREKDKKRYGDYADLKRLKEPKEEFEFDLYDYELEESSGGERSGRRSRGKVTLARGRGADMSKSERTTAAVAKKAGLKGTGKYSTKDLRKKSRDYTTYDSEDDLDDIGSTEQDHFIRTYSSARKAAKGEQLIKKYKPAGRTATGMTKLKTAPSSESVRRVKDLKKSMTKAGADKKGRVHTVDIMHRDSGVGKGDKDGQMERGRNFIAAVKDTPNQLKKAGAKKGEAVIGKPTAVMPGEDKKTGEAKRAKLYKKAFGKRSTKKSEKTGLMVGKAD